MILTFPKIELDLMYCRWDMSVAEDVHTKTKARSLAGMKDLASHGYSSCAKHLGCVQSPLISVPLDQVVLDELHLLLRVMDVLIRNLILYMDSQDHKNKAHQGEITHCVQQLEDFDHVVSVSRSGRIENQPIPGSDDFTALSGKYKLQVLERLPSKMDLFLPKGLAPQVAHLWKMNCFYSNITS